MSIDHGRRVAVEGPPDPARRSTDGRPRLVERDHEIALLMERTAEAVAGRGAMALVSAESGGGKSSLVDWLLDEAIERHGSDLRTLVAACDPLTTPRPLGPLRDLAAQLGPAARTALAESDHAHDIFTAVNADLGERPTLLVIDDLHWADQGTVDLLRFVLRRLADVPTLVVGTLRSDELGLMHPLRSLLGDVARSPVGATVPLAPLTRTAIEVLVEGRPLDAGRLLHLTGGNPFFVAEMLDHHADDLPATVRDAVLARTAGLGVGAWDLLHLLTAAPEAIPDRLLAALHVTVPALRELDTAGLLRRSARGVAFRHDLCRIAVSSVIPPGAEPTLHRRMIDALESSGVADPAVLVHHAIGAGDLERIAREADRAGRAAARSGAHTQAADFYRLALDQGAIADVDRADLLERLAAELYLIDRLADAIDAATEAMRARDEVGDVVGAGIDHNALSVYQWYNADRASAEAHVERTIRSLDGADRRDAAAEVTLGHAYAMRAHLAMHATRLDEAGSGTTLARAIAETTGDPGLTARVGIIDGARALLAGEHVGRERILSILDGAPAHLDEVYSSGYSNLTYLDVEQRRLDAAADLLDVSIPLMAEHDLPICRVWQVGARGRLAMMRGDWDAAVADAGDVIDGNSAPLALVWPYLVRGLVALRRTGAERGDDLEHAWELAVRYGEPIRQLPAASALAERCWITGVDDERVDTWISILHDGPRVGLEWARGELAVWLRRLGRDVDADEVSVPYAALLARDESAALRFDELGLTYDAALARIDLAPTSDVRFGLDVLDRLGADAVAAKVRRDLRGDLGSFVPGRRRTATRANAYGLTARQLEVLAAMSDGSTNAEVAERLYISEKTVDHHVSAILTKLTVANRRDAVRRARELDLVE